MLKQSFDRMKKGLAILLVVLFVVSLTSVAANAERGHGHDGHEHYGGNGHYGGHGRYVGYGDWSWGYGAGCTVDPLTGAIVCPTYGYPYI